MVTVPVVTGGGKLNYKHRSYTMSVFVVEPPFTRVFANKHPNAVRNGGWIDDTRYDVIRGGLFHNNLSFPENTVIMVQMSASVGGARVADAAVFYAIRDKAPVVRVNARIVVPAGFQPPSNTGLFYGHADRLSLDDLLARGIQPSAVFVAAHTDAEEISELFDMEELRAAVAPPPVIMTVENREGQKVTISAPAVVRRMRIRRNIS